MPRVAFIESDGTIFEGEAETGRSLMNAAQRLDVPGVVAECGGLCACSTCHCYVEGEWLERLEPMSEMEDGMLEAAYDRTSNSRLTCQIKAGEELDGIVLRVPARQRL